MKKLITAVIVLTTTSAWGSPIDWAQAEMVAERFTQSAVTLTPSAKLQRVVRKGTAASDAGAPLYVFNRAGGNGFVIVAGADAEGQCLAVAEC